VSLQYVNDLVHEKSKNCVTRKVETAVAACDWLFSNNYLEFTISRAMSRMPSNLSTPSRASKR
jgi:hypothetical protein